MLTFSALIFTLIAAAKALYPATSDVVLLNSGNFEKLVEQSESVWIVEFFAPWCGHCRALVPEYLKAATALKGFVKVGAVNCEEDKMLASRFDIRGYPTIKMFGADKKKPINYSGARTAEAIIDSAVDAARRKINIYLSGKTSKVTDSERDVVKLTDSNFESSVFNSKDYWLVEFYSPGCGHCQRLAPEWAEAATQLKGKAKLGAIDATSEHAIPTKFNIEGYPTIYWFEPGAKSKYDGKQYEGGRTSSDIVSWVIDMIQQNLPPPEIVQLTNSTILENQCSNNPLCVISVLPHILDCQSECRKNYIKMLGDVAEKYKTKFWGWIWVEAGAQPDLEQKLDIGGFGYPAMAVVNLKKHKFSLLRGSFSKDRITEFLRDLSFGRGQTFELRGGKLPTVQTTEPWDGKDQALPEDEDIDLSDVVLDDIKEEL
ncbi:UNVERIFIED_CONTAM: hypothetical protein PYX00_010310 [Menopon gallinae]|uniref:protein disulfide-isomerase n=1 Tax=Menopon gallinae TaxID=328185 RepID=A0AAW2HFD5_9NEOP